jgi:hypothetical protein
MITSGAGPALLPAHIGASQPTLVPPLAAFAAGLAAAVTSLP